MGGGGGAAKRKGGEGGDSETVRREREGSLRERESVGEKGKERSRKAYRLKDKDKEAHREGGREGPVDPKTAIQTIRESRYNVTMYCL